MKRIQFLFIALSFISISLSSQGQDLPSLKKSAEYDTGTLPNGVNYYIVANKAVKGFADFALIQKQVPEDNDPAELLCDLPHFQHHKPYRTLADLGVSCSQEGYVTSEGESVVYRFEEVPTYNTEYCDTTLLLLFDIIEKNPYQQTLVICGDVDVANIKGKLSIFSMTVPARKKVSVSDSYVWSPKAGIDVKVKKLATEDMALIRYIYSSGRVPRKSMGTVLPLMSEFYAHQAGYIIENRLQEAFRDNNIPAGKIRTEYIGEVNTSGDVTFSITIPVDRDNILSAGELSSLTLSKLANKGILSPELLQAKSTLMHQITRSVNETPLSDKNLVDKCIAAELYGANLASKTDCLDFFASKNVPVAQETAVFNKYLSAALNPYLNNFSVECLTPDILISASELRSIFETAWNRGKNDTEPIVFKIALGDTLSLFQEQPKKVKIKSETTEPMTGGKLWTFANGIKVIYKNIPSNGVLTYSFLLKDGTAAIPGLKHGEGAFVGDVLNCFDVSGMKWYDFRNMLQTNNIQMDTNLSISDLTISGAAPKQKLSLLLKSLISLANESDIDTESYRYFRNCKLLDAEYENLSDQGVKAISDSTLRPDYPYSDFKYPKYYSSSISEKVDKFFKKEFSKVNDGVIVFVGDLDENVLKGYLENYVGAFKVGVARSVRPKYQYFQRSGDATKIESSSESTAQKGVYLTLSTMSSLTMGKVLSFEIVKMFLKKSLVSRLSDSGVHIEVDGWEENSPQERFTLFVKITPCPAEGLPSCVSPLSSEQLLSEVREALEKACLTKISKKDMDGYKSVLTARAAYNITLPSYLCQAVQLRYSDGRDFTSKAAEKIKTLSEADVTSMLQEFYLGGRVEYVVY